MIIIIIITNYIFCAEKSQIKEKTMKKKKANPLPLVKRQSSTINK